MDFLQKDTIKNKKSRIPNRTRKMRLNQRYGLALGCFGFLVSVVFKAQI